MAPPIRQRSGAPMLSGNVATSKADLEHDLLRLLDAIDEPMSIATAIRDRDGRILDFRLEYVNEATARSAGVPRESMIMRAIRLGDGYISAWRMRTPTPKPTT